MAEITKEVSSSRCFGGSQKVVAHKSSVLGCEMNVAVYVPPQAETTKVPVLMYLSGLTCTEQNVITKAGAQRMCAKFGICLVCPDTSPRGVKIEGDDADWKVGTGAGYYVTATNEPWSKHYNMFQYVTEEVPALVRKNFNVSEDLSITGHSMGGHGALICALKRPELFKSVSAFAPISNASETDVSLQAFRLYFGDNTEEYNNWDATKLAKAYAGPNFHVLIDQGTDDGFYKEGSLRPEGFAEAAKANGRIEVDLRLQDGYDHGYYFISTFMEDHVAYHAKHLGLTN